MQGTQVSNRLLHREGLLLVLPFLKREMMRDKERILKIISDLLDNGQGFDFQSHGTRNDSEFFNFALYTKNHVPQKDRVTTYKHAYTLTELCDSIESVIRHAKPVAPVKKMPMPLPPGM